jgi:hypothetical protein
VPTAVERLPRAHRGRRPRRRRSVPRRPYTIASR